MNVKDLRKRFRELGKEFVDLGKSKSEFLYRLELAAASEVGYDAPMSELEAVIAPSQWVFFAERVLGKAQSESARLERVRMAGGYFDHEEYSVGPTGEDEDRAYARYMEDRAEVAMAASGGYYGDNF